METLSQKRLDNHFSKKIKEATGRLKKTGKKEGIDLSHFLYNMLYAEQDFQHKMMIDNKSPEAGLQVFMDYLDLYFVVTKLQYMVSLVSRTSILGLQYNYYMIEEVLNRIEQSDMINNTLINIYYHLYHVYTKDIPERKGHYFQARETLEKKGHELAISEQRNIYNFLGNHCIRMSKMGEQPYVEELFDLYDERCERDVIVSDDGYIDIVFYRNVAAVALRLGKVEWAREFIEKYKKDIIEYVREETYRYNLAVLHFYNKDYDQVLENLLDVSISDPNKHLLYKILLIKTYYELDEDIALQSTLEAFRIYLMRNKKKYSDYNVESMQQFVSFTKKLNRIKSGGTKTAGKLLQQIQQSKYLADSQWLKEKTEELIDSGY